MILQFSHFHMKFVNFQPINKIHTSGKLQVVKICTHIINSHLLPSKGMAFHAFFDAQKSFHAHWLKPALVNSLQTRSIIKGRHKNSKQQLDYWLSSVDVKISEGGAKNYNAFSTIFVHFFLGPGQCHWETKLLRRDILLGHRWRSSLEISIRPTTDTSPMKNPIKSLQVNQRKSFLVSTVHRS